MVYGLGLMVYGLGSRLLLFRDLGSRVQGSLGLATQALRV